MTPVKHGAVKKKLKVGEGTSRGQVRFDDHRFLGILQEERYRELSSRRIWSERRFDIHPEGCLRNYVGIITEKCWEKLANPNLHYEIIKEFYANALPIDGVEYPFVTMVRGKMILFDGNVINEYLGRPFTLEEGETDAFSKRMQRGNWSIGSISQSLLERGRAVVKNVVGLPIKFKKEDMKTRAQVALILMLYNIRPLSHTSTVPVESSYLLYFLFEGREVDVARIIANEI